MVFNVRRAVAVVNVALALSAYLVSDCVFDCL
jgi:hypothetical protein